MGLCAASMEQVRPRDSTSLQNVENALPGIESTCYISMYIITSPDTPAVMIKCIGTLSYRWLSLLKLPQLII